MPPNSIPTFSSQRRKLDNSGMQAGSGTLLRLDCRKRRQGGRFTFPQGQDRIAAIAFDLVSRRAAGVERLRLLWVLANAPGYSREMTMRAMLVFLSTIVTAAVAAAGPPAWPQFRGPAGSGVVPDYEKPPSQIGPDKNVRWKVAVPSGPSSPVIAGDQVFLTGFEGGKLLTLAYRSADGTELWRKEAPAKAVEPFMPSEGSPAASTPATDGNSPRGLLRLLRTCLL